ncbi:MAG: cob(I)yrinic acid a,c-diamide adenosyltransferase [Anaerolineales bacterium]|nr:cob(I)yrinic acid a,c-diamide adenosyltransferase [Anaerolineales bacterium]
MPRLTKLYTRGGDEGETSLGGGQRVAKDDARVAAYGTVDELNACLGLALAQDLSPRLDEVLRLIQNELFHLGCDLCFLEQDKAQHALPRIERRHIEKLEALIDELNQVVGRLQNFILPGGWPGAAALHLARTVCRRAERAVVRLARAEPIGEYALRYLNRLSDLLFVMARYENKQRGVVEPLWNSWA